MTLTATASLLPETQHHDPDGMSTGTGAGLSTRGRA
jgi:hypothetical protein